MKNKLHLKVNDETELKTLKREDAIELFMLILKNKKWLAKYLEWIPKINNPYDIIDYISNNEYNSYYDPIFPLAIHYDNKIVGIISFQNGNSFKKEVEIGYWISEEYSGKGIVTLATKTLINFAFSMSNIKSILICCEIANIKSYKIPQNLKFEFIKEEEGKGYYRDGNPVKLTYQLLKDK